MAEIPFCAMSQGLFLHSKFETLGPGGKTKQAIALNEKPEKPGCSLSLARVPGCYIHSRFVEYETLSELRFALLCQRLIPI